MAAEILEVVCMRLGAIHDRSFQNLGRVREQLTAELRRHLKPRLWISRMLDCVASEAR